MSPKSSGSASLVFPRGLQVGSGEDAHMLAFLPHTLFCKGPFRVLREGSWYWWLLHVSVCERERVLEGVSRKLVWSSPLV